MIMADFDLDGWKDVFVTNGVKRDVNNNDVNVQYQETSLFGNATSPDFRLLPSTPVTNYAFRNHGDYRFTNTTQAWELDQPGFSHGIAYADLDADGDLDLVINNMDEEAAIYLNEAQQANNRFLKILCKGPEHNPLGLGTKIWVKSEGYEQMQEAYSYSRLSIQRSTYFSFWTGKGGSGRASESSLA